jgi:Uma2 family endonuclease
VITSETEKQTPKPFHFTRDQYIQMSEWGWFTGRKVELIGGEVWDQYGDGKCPEPALRHFSREEYYQILNLGWFAVHRVELIDGELFEMPAQLDVHLASVTLSHDALRIAFGPGYWVRVQGSLDLSPNGIPDPDLAVTAGNPRGAAHAIATSALLVVEVSESTLAFDRGRKANLYAAGSIADYWVVNLIARQLEV